MQKLIPTIYFYVVSLIGLVLLIIGIFAGVHFVVGVTAYNKYPLDYAPETRCSIPVAPAPEGKTAAQLQISSQDECLKSVEKERATKKAADLEKALSFTLIGMLVFGIHFYYARRKLK